MPIINEIYYETAGEGHPVILIHCPAVHSVYWRPLMNRLQTVCQTVSFDFPGHGKSPHRGPWDFSDIAEIVKMLTLELGLNKPLLVGFSSGGCVALESALAEPEMYSGIIMVGGLSECSDWFLRSEIATGLVMIKMGMSPIIARSVAFANRESMKHYREMIPLSKRVSPESLASFLVAIRKCELTPRLKEIQIPVHLVYGAWDQRMHRYYRILRDGLPCATTSFVPWTGHRVPTQRPNDFAQIVARFLEQVSGSGYPMGPITPTDRVDLGLSQLH